MATIRLRIVVRAQDSSPERKFIVLVPQGNTVTWLKGEIGRVYTREGGLLDANYTVQKVRRTRDEGGEGRKRGKSKCSVRLCSCVCVVTEDSKYSW